MALALGVMVAVPMSRPEAEKSWGFGETFTLRAPAAAGTIANT